MFPLELLLNVTRSTARSEFALEILEWLSEKGEDELVLEFYRRDLQESLDSLGRRADYLKTMSPDTGS